MSNQTNRHACENRCTAAAIMALVVLTSVMLLAMFTRTEPHPPFEVAPFALAPFLAASLAIGVAAHVLITSGARFAIATALLFALTALVSYGPQKYFDPALPRIWPAVVVAQVAIVVIVTRAIGKAVRLMRPGDRSDH